MTTTKAAIRRRAVSLARTNGRSRGFATRNGINALTATAGGVRTLTDTAGLPPAGVAESVAKGWWVFLPSVAAAADRRRLVASYDSSARAVTHEGPDYDAATITELNAATEPYLLLQDDPDFWEQALQESLRTLLSQTKYDEFTPTVNRQVRYTVAAAPITLTGITRASQIFDIERHDVDEVSGEERWEPWADGYRTWRAYMDEDDVILDFEDPDRAPATTDRLRIKWVTQYATVAAEDTAIDVDEAWAAYAVLIQMADWLADANNPEDDWTVIGRRARAQYHAQRRAVQGVDAYRQVARTAQQTGMAGVRGRGGRR